MTAAVLLKDVPRDSRVAIPPRVNVSAFHTLDPDAQIYALTGQTMGTGWSVKLAAAAPPPVGLREAIQATLDGVVGEMSNWEPGSALSRFNRAAPGTWHCLPSGFFRVLTAGLEVARLTGGAFDPSLGDMVDLWGFGPRAARFLPPDRGEIQAAHGRSGWRRLVVDEPSHRVFQPGGVALDLSGIAKGHAVDRVASLLVTQGVFHALVEIGGELKGIGLRPDRQPWWVEIEAPPALAIPETRVALHGLAIATSGDYRRFFEADGRRFAHSIDPRTGEPAMNDLTSVSVLHEDCMLADAFATALIVMGLDQGLAFSEEHGLAALFTSRNGSVTDTSGLSRMIL